jgi:uncharacterized protein (UPF0332 family)
MSNDVEARLAMADEALAAARALLDLGHWRAASSRAYYSMFYVAEALLASRGLAYSKHTAVQANYGREFAQSGKFPPKYHRWLLDAAEDRHDADYGLYYEPNTAEVVERVEHAAEFLSVARCWLAGEPSP